MTSPPERATESDPNLTLLTLFPPGSFARYVMVGVSNTVAGVAVFALLYWIFGESVSVNYLLVANWVINNLLGFLLHKVFTFEVGGSSSKQFPKFLALSLLSLGTHVGVLNLVRTFVHINPVIVVLLTNFLLAGVFMIINYFGMRRFVFKKGKG